MASKTSPTLPTKIEHIPKPASRASNGHGASSPAFAAIGRRPRLSIYRPARPFTYELSNHSRAYLEAEQYAGGYAFLSNLLITGISISTPAKPYDAFLAPPPQLALAATLVVYPLITTKARPVDKIKGSDAALRYLQNVRNTISPLDESLKTAFSFPDERSRRRAEGYRAMNTSPDPENDFEQLTVPTANALALWYRAKDFWHIVGWAFNCSAAHKKRWERWKLWLDFMVGFLEAEWEERVKKSNEEGVDSDKILLESLLWHYISSEDPASRSNRKRIIKSILAMGGSQSNLQFPEVWAGETAELKPEADDKSLETIDIEKGELGIFKSEEDVEMQDAPKQPVRSARSRKKYTDDRVNSPSVEDDTTVRTWEDAVERLGGMDAVQLRQRLLGLMTQVAQALPRHFTKLGEFFDPLTEEMMSLPTLILHLLLSTSRMPGLAQMALNANLLLPLTSGRLPDYTNIHPDQSHLEDYMLPLRATTQSYAANAKLSLILEQMLMYMLSTKGLQATESLRNVVEKGIEERHKVYGTAKGKKGNAREEEIGKDLIAASSERLLSLLEILEISSGKQPEERRKRDILSFSTDLSELSSPPESENDTDEDG